MNFGDLFDGKAHELYAEDDFYKPWLTSPDEPLVIQEVQPDDQDPLEPLDRRFVTTDAPARLKMWWELDEGWTATSTMLGDLAKALGGQGKNMMKVKHSADPSAPKELSFFFKYEPREGNPNAWRGGAL